VEGDHTRLWPVKSEHTATQCNKIEQHATSLLCYTLQHIATHCNRCDCVLQCVGVCCSALHRARARFTQLQLPSCALAPNHNSRNSCSALQRERDCLYYVIVQIYDAGLHVSNISTRREVVEFRWDTQNTQTLHYKEYWEYMGWKGRERQRGNGPHTSVLMDINNLEIRSLTRLSLGITLVVWMEKKRVICRECKRYTLRSFSLLSRSSSSSQKCFSWGGGSVCDSWLDYNLVG